MLRRIGIIAVLSLIVAALAAVPALAQTPHFENLVIAGTGSDQVAATGSLVELTRHVSCQVCKSPPAWFHASYPAINCGCSATSLRSSFATDPALK